MTFTDLAIIYLACGAPLSMHYFFAARRKPVLYFAAKVVLVALVWPVAAFWLMRSLRKPVGGVVLSGVSEIERRLDSLRIEIEKAAFADESAAAVFEFRELFARYTGLALASNIRFELDSPNELFQLSGHTNEDLASRCLRRKASNRLAMHANASREDFVESIAALEIGAQRSIVPGASAVAELVADAHTVGLLGEFETGRSEAKFRSVTPEKTNSPKPLRAAIG